MNKTKKFFYIMIAITLIAQTSYITIYSPRELRSENVELTQEVETLSMVVELKDWQYGAKVSGNNDLLKEVEFKEQELTDLKADQLAVSEMIEILEYCVVYIHWLQIRMADNGLDYPVFIIEAVLGDLLEEGIVKE